MTTSRVALVVVLLLVASPAWAGPGIFAVVLSGPAAALAGAPAIFIAAARTGGSVGAPLQDVTLVVDGVPGRHATTGTDGTVRLDASLARGEHSIVAVLQRGSPVEEPSATLHVAGYAAPSQMRDVLAKFDASSEEVVVQMTQPSDPGWPPADTVHVYRKACSSCGEVEIQSLPASWGPTFVVYDGGLPAGGTATYRATASNAYVAGPSASASVAIPIGTPDSITVAVTGFRACDLYGGPCSDVPPGATMTKPAGWEIDLTARAAGRLMSGDSGVAGRSVSITHALDDWQFGTLERGASSATDSSGRFWSNTTWSVFFPAAGTCVTDLAHPTAMLNGWVLATTQATIRLCGS